MSVVPLMLNAKQAATAAGVGLRTWLRMTACGLAPPPKRIGLGPRPMTRWAVAEIQQWIESGCQPVQKGSER